jgi:hypothetical protein
MIHATEREMIGDDENGPKRRVWRRLGHRYVFLKFSRIFLILNNVKLRECVVDEIHAWREKRKAATMRTGAIGTCFYYYITCTNDYLDI